MHVLGPTNTILRPYSTHFLKVLSIISKCSCGPTPIAETTDGKVHDVNVLDRLVPEPGTIYIMDRAYLDFNRLYQLHQCSGIFVTRSKTNTGLRRIYSNKIDKSTGVRCDQTDVLTGYYSKKDYPEKLRRIKYYDTDKGRSFVFLTNQFTLPPIVIAELYRYWWRVEIFFKWIKQHQ
jgi:IS4 transposase